MSTATLSPNTRSQVGLPRDELTQISPAAALDRDSFGGMPDQASPSLRQTRGVSNALLDAARDVALAAAGGDVDAARLVSKGAWDAARERAGHADMLTAETLRQKLRVPSWRAALAVAFLSPNQRSGAIGSYRKRVSALGQGADLPKLRASSADVELIKRFLAEDFLVGDDDVVLNGKTVPQEDRFSRGVSLASPEVLEAIITRAVRSVAYRLGYSPTAVAYDDMLRRMESERDRAGLPPLGFPGSRTIVERVGWAKAVATAGLEPPRPHTRPKGLPVVDVLDEYVERNGIVPGFDCFRAWTAACRLSVQHRQTDTWDVIVAELRAKRSERGRETPEGIVRRKRDWPPLPARRRRRRSRRSWVGRGGGSAGEPRRRHARGFGSTGVSIWAQTSGRATVAIWRPAGVTSGWCGHPS